MADKKTKKYRVLCWGACVEGAPCGINYPSARTAQEVRAETGDVVDDIPAIYVADLIAAGTIEPVVDEEGGGQG